MVIFISKFILTGLTVIETVKVSSKGQIVIPERIRHKYNIMEGTKLILRESKNTLILETETEFLHDLELMEKQKENQGWLMVSQKSLEKDWLSEDEEENWKDL